MGAPRRIASFAFFLAASSAAAQTGELPVIRSSTHLVQVSLVVTDKNGPVAGLKKEDFVLFDGKKQRNIASFSEESSGSVLPASGWPLPSNVFSNSLDRRPEASSSVTIILLDGHNTRIEDQAYAHTQLTKFLARLEPDDRVAIYSLGRSLMILHDFTNDRQELARLIAAFRGRLAGAPASLAADPGAGGSQQTAAASKISQALADMEKTMIDFDLAARARFTTEALTAIASHVAPLPGRKNLVWISASFPLTIGMEDLNIRSSRATQNFTEYVDRAARALNSANVAVYPVDARGLMVLPSFSASISGLPPAGANPAMRMLRSGRDTMQDLASHTGGRAFYDTNDIAGSVRRAIDDTKASYTLGFYADAADLDGKYHLLKVQVRGRKGLELRHRKGYYALNKSQLPEASQKFALDAALRSPLQASAIPMTVRLSAAGDASPGGFRLSLVLGLREVVLTPNDGRWQGAICIRVAQLDAQSQVLDVMTDTVTLNFRNENYAQYRDTGLPISRPVNLKPGAGQLRIIALDSNAGAVGSVIVPVSGIAH